MKLQFLKSAFTSWQRGARYTMADLLGGVLGLARMRITVRRQHTLPTIAYIQR